MAAATFKNEDEEAQYCLSLLRDGTPSEKIAARNQLAVIFSRRGLHLEATELYEANVRAGVHAPDLFERLSDSYRQIGDGAAAEAALAEARRLREAARPRPALVPQPPQPQPPPQPPLQVPSPTLSPPDGSPGEDANSVLQFSAVSTGRLPARPAPTPQPIQPSPPPAVTAQLPSSRRHDPDLELVADLPAGELPTPRRVATAPGPLLLLGMVVGLVAVPIVALALLIVNPVALYLEGRPAGPTVDAAAPTPARLKVAAGSEASWYVQSGRSVSGFWATPGLGMTLAQELDGAGATFEVTAPRPQGWGETITIVERRGQGRMNQETVLLATFAAPNALPPSGTVIDGRIAGEVTAPRLSETGQFTTTTESIDVPVQLVVVSTPELWLDRFSNSVRMFFLEDRWLLVTIGALLSWCVLAGATAILLRERHG